MSEGHAELGKAVLEAMETGLSVIMNSRNGRVVAYVETCAHTFYGRMAVTGTMDDPAALAGDVRAAAGKVLARVEQARVKGAA